MGGRRRRSGPDAGRRRNGRAVFGHAGRRRNRRAGSGLGGLVDTVHSVLCADGFIVQVMPFADDAVITKLEENLKHIPYVTDMQREGASQSCI